MTNGNKNAPYKSMENLSCHSNKLTTNGNKNIVFIEPNVMNISLMASEEIIF